MPAGTVPKIKDWLADYEKVFFQAAASSLGLKDGAHLDQETTCPPRSCGAYLPLVCGEEEIIIALVAAPEVCQTLAKKLIMAEESEPLALEDMADAIKEVVNIVAGMLKTEAAKYKLTIKLGLPFFLDGHIDLTKNQEMLCARVAWGELESRLAVIGTRSQDQDFVVVADQPLHSAERTSQEWLGEALTAAFTLSMSTLGMEKYQVKKIIQSFPENEIAGAYMPLIGDEDAILFGILSNNAGLQAIARALLQLPPNEPLDREMTADAIKEVLNIMSGIVKQQLFKQNTNYKLALPFFIDGYIEVTENQEAMAALIEMGGARTYMTYLVIIRKKNKTILI